MKNRRTPRIHLDQSFVWNENMTAYEALRCEECKASRWAKDKEECKASRWAKDKCESCCGTGIDAIPISEVMSK